MKLITYLTFAGNCEEALNFYKEALGAEVLMVSRMGDGQMEVPENLKDKIMHARLGSEKTNCICQTLSTLHP